LPEQQPPAGAKQGGIWHNWIRPCLVVALGLLAFRSMVLDWNVVPSGSMRPTILEGDYILVNRAAYALQMPLLGTHLLTWAGPRRGDIVVFNPPGETDRYVKRVVGVPGDQLEMRDNQLYVNEQPAPQGPLDAETVARLRQSLQPGEEVEFVRGLRRPPGVLLHAG
jgi:signal peptidase I